MLRCRCITGQVMRSFCKAALWPGVLLASLALPLAAQSRGPAPGIWRCVVNSDIVSIDITFQIDASQALIGQGTIVYMATGRIVPVQGAGSWAALPPDHTSPDWLYRFQMAPVANHAVFSLYARPTEDPNFLYNDFRDATGRSETACQRVG